MPAKRPVLVHERRVLPMAKKTLRIVCVADTHSRPHPDCHRWLSALAPDQLVHAGDIGDLEVLEDLRKIAPLTAVRGNIDAGAPGLPDVVTLDVRDDAGSLIKILLVHIAVYGPKLRAEIARLAHAEGASLVVCGHSHVPFIGRDKGVTVFNPGSVGPRRFQLPIVFGVVDVDRTRVDVRHVSCETGERWTPERAPGAA